MKYSGITVCSNRGPVSFELSDRGYSCRRTGPNGLIPVVYPAFREIGGRWLFAARTAVDERVAQESSDGFVYSQLDVPLILQPLSIPADINRSYYEEFSVGQLAMLFHYLFPLSWFPNGDEAMNAAWSAYQVVNRIFARSLLRIPNNDPILVQDYHLLLVAEEVKFLCPQKLRPLIYFHHVAWCEPSYFGTLPDRVRDRILHGMTSFDVIAFHSRRWADAFLSCCERFLVHVQRDVDRIRYGDRSSHIVVSPATIDPNDVLEEAKAAAFCRWQRVLTEKSAGRWTLVRVERADLWKNPLRGLLAIELFLSNNPETVGKTWFLVVLTPTRIWREDYVNYLEECKNVAMRINSRFSDHHLGNSVEMVIASDPHAPDRALALAAMSVADALFVTPTFDGLNIIPKEAVVVSTRDPVVILSQNSGIYEEISDLALGVNPFDIHQTAQSIGEAYKMSRSERRTKAAEILSRVTARHPQDWIKEQISSANPARR